MFILGLIFGILGGFCIGAGLVSIVDNKIEKERNRRYFKW